MSLQRLVYQTCKDGHWTCVENSSIFTPSALYGHDPIMPFALFALGESEDWATAHAIEVRQCGCGPDFSDEPREACGWDLLRMELDTKHWNHGGVDDARNTIL